MMEIDGEIMQFISEGRNKQNGIEKRKKEENKPVRSKTASSIS